jgi:hypothetical protein
MIRRVSTLLSALSLILCVVTAALWAWSYDHGFDVEDVTARTASGSVAPVVWNPPERLTTYTKWRLDSYVGRLVLRRSAVHIDSPTIRIGWSPEDGIGLRLRFWLREADGVREDLRELSEAEQEVRNYGGWIGCGAAAASGPHAAFKIDGVRSTLTLVIVPYWLACVLFAAIPGLWLAAAVRRRFRRTAGLCPACGYDLRASPDRCPECGTLPTAKISN